MAEGNENLNSLKEEKTTLEEELTTLDSEADAVRVSEVNERLSSIKDELVTVLDESNKKLFERTKKAEGFEKQEDGTWVKKPVETKKPEVKAEKPDIDTLLDEKLNKKELDSLDLSEDLQKEVENYAKLNKVSIKKALSSDYIVFLKEKADKKIKAEDASLGGGRKGTALKDYSKMTASDFNMTTKEGREDFKKWEEHIRKELG